MRFTSVLFLAIAIGLAQSRVVLQNSVRDADYYRRTYKLGVAKDAREVTRREMTVQYLPTSGAIPATFDARQQWPTCVGVISDIRDQGQCGSCWAVAAAECYTDRACIATDDKVNMPYSSWDIATCCKECAPGEGCQGGYPGRAWDWLVSTGVVTGGPVTNCTGCKPYPSSFGDEACHQTCQSGYNIPYEQDKRKATTSFMIPQDIGQIQTAIMTGGPVEAAFDVYDDFFSYTSGVYQHKTGGLAGGHAVRVLGWGNDAASGLDYWLVANSWGTNWGMSGYFKIRRGNDECGFEEAMTAGNVPGGSAPTGPTGAPPTATTGAAACPSGTCQSGETCCSEGGGNWGCCPLPNATCCTDLKHCCPSGTTCCDNFTRCCSNEGTARAAFLSSVLLH